MKRKILITTILLIPTISNAAELTFQFKDPAFSGYGWAAQVQTINQQEQNAKNNKENKQQAAIDKAKAEAANTPLAKFMALFQAQVYAQLATQLSNNLFGEGGNSNTGSFTLDGNTISYVKSPTDVTLTVVDSAGHSTVVKVPISQFKF
jgi:hypothetical protein